MSARAEDPVATRSVTIDQRLIGAVRVGLAAAANPEDAGPMQRYMKSALPFRGVKAGPRRKLLRPIFVAHPLERWDDLRDTALALWREASFREERYAVTDLLRQRRYRSYVVARALPLFEELIVTGAWWDHVDEIAGHLVRDALIAEPGPLSKAMRRWMRDDDLWKRRTSIICQLGRKADTDRALLVEAIEAAWHDRDFFLRKAIGWALRDYGRAEPDWVRDFVARHDAELSPLSRREALKNL